VLVSVEHGRAELTAQKFSRRPDLRGSPGEWWAHPSGFPIYFLQHCGDKRDYFDSDQLAHVLSQSGPFRPGMTIGGPRQPIIN